MQPRKLFIDDSQDPWITWDSDLYKLQEASRGTPKDMPGFYGIEVVANPWMADLFFINHNTIDIRDELFKGKDVFVFMPEFPQNAQEQLKTLQDVKYADDNNWTVVTESQELYDKLQGLGLKQEPWLWRRPSRVSADEVFNETPLNERKCKIVAVFDAGHPLSHAAELVKGYLSAFMVLRDDYNTEPILEIYSHSDMPFEPFNEIHFQGMTPNKRMFKALRDATLFIFPSETDKYPNTMMEAAQLGVPSIQFWDDSSPIRQHLMFPDQEWSRFRTSEELADKIVEHFSTFDDLDRVNDTINHQKSVVAEESMEYGCEIFITEMARRLSLAMFADEEAL